MTGYELTRNWFDFSFENPDKVKPRHTALYLFTADLCNRLGWKKKFGLPTKYTMEAVGIGNYNTYKRTLADLIDWGFIEIITKSKNQYSANVIALCKSAKAKNKAMDKALLNQCQSTESIDKPINNKTLKNKTLLKVDIKDVPDNKKKYFKLALNLQQVVYKNLRDKDAPTSTQENADFRTWVNPIQSMIEKDGVTISQIERAIKILKNSEGNFWKGIILSSEKLREKLSQLLLSGEGNLSKESMSNMNESVKQKLKKYE